MPKKCGSCKKCSSQIAKTPIVGQGSLRNFITPKQKKKGKVKNISYLVLALEERKGRLSFSVPAIKDQQISVFLGKLLSFANDNSEADLFQFEGVETLVSHGFETREINRVMDSDN